MALTRAVERLLDGRVVSFTAFAAHALHAVELPPDSVRLFEIEP